MQEMTTRVVINPFNQNLLSAQVTVTADLPMKYRYTVKGKTLDSSFIYSTNEYILNPTIPVIGLYANTSNTISIECLFNDGSNQTVNVTADTTGQDYGVIPLNVTFAINDERIAQETLYQGWLVTCFYTAYDKNGDLRMAFTNAWDNNNLKSDGHSIYPGFDIFPTAGENYAQTLRQMNLLGETRQSYSVPAGYGFHHDITFGPDGNMFCLVTLLENPTAQQRQQSTIYKYDVNNGNIIWSRDYSEYFDNQDVCIDAQPNDAHFNSLEYSTHLKQLILNNRSTSTIYGLNMESGDIEWTIDNPMNSLVAATVNLKPLPGFAYPNGEHAVFPTTNPKYADFLTENRLAITLFNNKAALFDDGSENNKKMEDPIPDEYYEAPFDSQSLVYGIDLNNQTVELLDTFTIPGKRSNITSEIHEIGNYYSIMYGVGSQFFIIDTNNKVAVECDAVYPAVTYRGRIFTFEELRRLI
ncbi:TPA: aryl-sulfate sulfotransferase [Citrobacter amalonaticus]|uniref:Aryl-sulfate sulfotransferase n=1 Tax=Citrobacter amalonaticus TaxID=35703 RepID=A0A9C7QNX3_CITAM|nr:aryl-sulfate sulfotransferase [Citrobacter amalonaticus]